jgi:hypothetical protein
MPIRRTAAESGVLRPPELDLLGRAFEQLKLGGQSQQAHDAIGVSDHRKLHGWREGRGRTHLALQAAIGPIALEPKPAVAIMQYEHSRPEASR